jgi:hypothetical protein
LYSSSVLPNQFVDVAHLPILLSNHGAGLGHLDVVHALSLWRTRPRQLPSVLLLPRQKTC